MKPLCHLRSPSKWMKWVICEEALYEYKIQNTYAHLERTVHSYIHYAYNNIATAYPPAVLKHKNQWLEMFHKSCCSLTTLVACRSWLSPWCVQKRDDELNAVCLCPRRDHHINTALIQCSVCCMLIKCQPFFSHSFPHIVSLLCETNETGEKRQTPIGCRIWIRHLSQHKPHYHFYISSCILFYRNPALTSIMKTRHSFTLAQQIFSIR